MIPQKRATFVIHQLASCLFFPAFKLIMSIPQLVPGGLTEPAVPRNATAYENILLAVTPKQGTVSARLHTTVCCVRKVEVPDKIKG